MKKTAVLAAVVLMAALAAQPAMAGVGGCRIPGVGGCKPGGWQLTTDSRVDETVTLFDAVGSAIPVQFGAFLRAMAGSSGSEQGSGLQDTGSMTDSGVGGCFPRPGVGGCWL